MGPNSNAPNMSPASPELKIGPSSGRPTQRCSINSLTSIRSASTCDLPVDYCVYCFVQLVISVSLQTAGIVGVGSLASVRHHDGVVIFGACLDFAVSIEIEHDHDARLAKF